MENTHCSNEQNLGVLQTLEEFQLPNGVSAAIRRLIPPVPEFTAEASAFTADGDTENRRSITSRLDGRYAAGSEDLYYWVIIGKRAVARAWLGYGLSPFPIANFGQVYTMPEFRRMGVASRLMRWLAADLESGPVQGAFCCAGTSELARFYAPYGFRPLISGADCGPLGWMRGHLDFSTFRRNYYLPCERLTRRPAAMRYRHEIDRLLDFSLQADGLGHKPVLTGDPATLQQALFRREDGELEAVDVFLTPAGRVVGWGFQRGTRSFREIHPSYSTLSIGE